MLKMKKVMAAGVIGFSLIFQTMTPMTGGILGRPVVMAEKADINQELQSSIAKLIGSKAKSYDFMKDAQYIELMNKLGTSLLTKYSQDSDKKAGVHFAIGNLDGDNIPELAVYEQRDPSNIDDEGALTLYKYMDGAYRQLDKISMNYDNTGIQMVIGKAAAGKNALLMNTGVGAHSEAFYLFTLEGGKLQSRINEKKVSLLSVYSSAEIKDIDKDGIIEFSIYTIDPVSQDQSSAGSDKMLVWYKWDGKDGVKLVKCEKKSQSKPAKSDAAVISKFNSLMKSSNNMPQALAYLKTNINKLSRKDSTALIDAYLTALKKNMDSVNNSFYKLQDKYMGAAGKDILKKYNLKLADVNNINVLKKASVFSKEKDFKDLLIKANGMGLKVLTSEGMYFFVVDYQSFVNLSANASDELNEYLKLCAFESNKMTTSDAAVIITWDELAQRIAAVEDFKRTYTYSKYINEIKQQYERYMMFYIFGTNNTPAYDYQTYVVKPEVLKSYNTSLSKYEGYVFHDIVKVYMETLKQSKNKVTQSVMDKMYKVIKENL